MGADQGNVVHCRCAPSRTWGTFCAPDAMQRAAGTVLRSSGAATSCCRQHPQTDAWRRWCKRPGSAPHRSALRRVRGTAVKPIAPNCGDVPHRRQTPHVRPLDPGAPVAARQASGNARGDSVNRFQSRSPPRRRPSAPFPGQAPAAPARRAGVQGRKTGVACCFVMAGRRPGRAPSRPSTSSLAGRSKTWMPATSAGMTWRHGSGSGKRGPPPWRCP